MKQTMINRITFCKKCSHAFIINIEGNEDTCDSCIAEEELNQELWDEGILTEVQDNE